jgi:hypothetical protein
MGLVKFSLVTADLLLVATTILWQRQAKGHMGVGEAILCTAAIVCAGWLSALAAWLHFRRR